VNSIQWQRAQGVSTGCPLIFANSSQYLAINISTKTLQMWTKSFLVFAFHCSINTVPSLIPQSSFISPSAALITENRFSNTTHHYSHAAATICIISGYTRRTNCNPTTLGPYISKKLVLKLHAAAALPPRNILQYWQNWTQGWPHSRSRTLGRINKSLAIMGLELRIFLKKYSNFIFPKTHGINYYHQHPLYAGYSHLHT
jgi:hypothetical protein